MSVRTEWSRAAAERPEIVDEWVDAYGTGLDEGGLALLLGVDSAFVIEAPGVAQIREFAAAIVDACDRFEASR